MHYIEIKENPLTFMKNAIPFLLWIRMVVLEIKGQLEYKLTNYHL